MSELVIRHGTDADGGPFALAISGGHVVERAEGPTLDTTGLSLLPGLLDLQVTGCAGIDNTAEPTRLWEVGAALAPHGVTAFLPTVITSSPDARDRQRRRLDLGARGDVTLVDADLTVVATVGGRVAHRRT